MAGQPDVKNYSETLSYLIRSRGHCQEESLSMSFKCHRYVENNPVPVGKVKRAWEYPRSSAKFHIGKKIVEEAFDYARPDTFSFANPTFWRGTLQQ
jgi:hypothetical protein